MTVSEKVEIILGWIDGYFKGRTLANDLLPKYPSFREAAEERDRLWALKTEVEEELRLWAYTVESLPVPPDDFLALSGEDRPN